MMQTIYVVPLSVMPGFSDVKHQLHCKTSRLSSFTIFIVSIKYIGTGQRRLFYANDYFKMAHDFRFLSMAFYACPQLPTHNVFRKWYA